MDDIDQKLDTMGKKLDDVKKSVDKIKKIFLWTLIISIILFVVPLVGLVFAIPKFLGIYSGYGNLLP